MKNNCTIKCLDSNHISDTDLNLINKYTVKPLGNEDVKIFKLTLCDNDIDRDFECFSVDSLNTLSELFIGKPGIMDHSMRSSDQVARIFQCSVEKSDTDLNTIGEPYHRLIAKAYIVKNDKNNEIISDIEGGIKKEVSVNCSINEKICSICNKDYNTCSHTAGKLYDINGQNMLCYVILNKPVDAYEWSFVAVPAQKNAGIIKHFNDFKELSSKLQKNSLSFSNDEIKIIYQKIAELEKCNTDGKEYRKSIQKNFMKKAFEIFPDIDGNILSSISNKLTIDELSTLSKAFENIYEKKSVAKPQFSHTNIKSKKNNFQQFKI